MGWKTNASSESSLRNHVRNRVYWIDLPATVVGRFAILARPPGGREILSAVSDWARSGIEVVVSMLTVLEIDELKLSDEGRVCEESNITFVRCPVDDRGVPSTARTEYKECVDRLAAMLRDGYGVGIHCRAGIGRSGMLAACVLRRLGFETDMVIRLVSKARGVTIPDTEAQRDWIAQEWNGIPD